MGIGWGRWIPVVAVAVVCVPVALVFVALRARRNGWKYSLAESAVVLGPIPWVWMILTPLHQPREFLWNPIDEAVTGVGERPVFFTVQMLANLLPFATLGAGLPVRWPVPLWAVGTFAALFSATLEFLQYALYLGRTASVADVLLNTSGAILAALLTRPWWRTRAGAPTPAAGTVGPR
ncbi:VanZ family protein [Virgisporangium aliadipatigenens]|nr:VanZ family protein [Virgisporangium aliadipatigenens]